MNARRQYGPLQMEPPDRRLSSLPTSAPSGPSAGCCCFSAPGKDSRWNAEPEPLPRRDQGPRPRRYRRTEHWTRGRGSLVLFWRAGPTQIRANFEELLGGGETNRSCMMLAIRPTAIRHGSMLLPPLRGYRIVAANQSTARSLITVTTPGSFVLGIGRRQFSRASRTRPDQSVSNFRLLARGVYYLRIPFLVLSG